MDLERLRAEYGKLSLSEAVAGDDPLQLLNVWLEDAVKAEVLEPNAFALSTVDAAGRPSSRIVLLRGVSAEGGLRFFTNYHSRKGRELAGRPFAAALLFWPALERQVRIGGRVSRLPAEESDAYFASRPHGSRLAALTSSQSEPTTREELEARFAQLSQQHPEGSAVPRPAHWGGYQLLADDIEFWQGGAHRLHDRIEFTRAGAGWARRRLSP